jgi:hypothetical protein
LKNPLSKLIRWENEPSLAPRGIGAKEQERNILEVFHHVEALQEINPIAREQALIQKDEVWFATAKELQGRQPISSDDELIASLLCKHLTKVEVSGQVIPDEQDCFEAGLCIAHFPHCLSSGKQTS